MLGRVTVLGAGSWGMAIAYLLDKNGAEVTLWEHDTDACRRLWKHRGNARKLKRFILAESIEITDNVADALRETDFIALAIPSQRLRSALKNTVSHVSPDAGIVNLAKGIESGSLKRMSEVVCDVLSHDPDLVCTLSGPSHAEEVVRDMATTVTVAGGSEELLRRVQRTFSNSHFRVYRSNDLVGVELGGSLKNIIAIASGIADGLGMGDNCRGAIISRGLAEITRLGMTMGAQDETFSGLSGLGDLVTTCVSQHSRNRFVGDQIGSGKSLMEVVSQMAMVAEGVETTRSGYELAREHDVQMPITSEVYQVLFEDKAPVEALNELMDRELKPEKWT